MSKEQKAQSIKKKIKDNMRKNLLLRKGQAGIKKPQVAEIATKSTNIKE